MNRKPSTFWAILWYETKMAWRRPAWWGWVGLCFGIGWLSIDKEKLPWVTAWNLAITPANALAVWGSLLLPIFAVGPLLREMSVRYEWYWVRLEDERIGFVSKLLAVYLNACLGLIPAYLYAAYFLARFYGLQGLLLQSLFWPILILPSFGASLTITLTLSLAIRSVFLTLLGALAVIGGFVLADWDATRLFALAPTTIFSSATTGFGPIRVLLYLNRLFWLFIAIFFLWFSCSLVKRVQPRVTQPVSMLWRFGIASLMGVTVITILGIGLFFRKEHQRVFYQSVLPPVSKAQASCEWLERYDVNLLVDATAGIVSGTVHLRTTVPYVDVSYDFTPGLAWRHFPDISADTIRVDRERSILTLNARGGSNGDFTLRYQGWPKMPKAFVSCRSCLDTPEYHYAPFPERWYLDSRSIFLTRDDGWHPFPNCVPDRLSLVLENFPCQDEACLFHTADDITVHTNSIRAEWNEVTAGPLLAATNRYVAETVKNITTYIPEGVVPDHLRDDLIAPYAVALSRMAAFGLLHTNRSPLKIAVVPLFRYPRFSDRGGLFVPERALVSRAYVSEVIFARFATEQVVGAWWCAGSVCPDVMQTTPYDFFFTGAGHSPASSDVLETLIQYTAFRLWLPDVPFSEADTKMFVESDAALMQRLDALYNQNRAAYWRLVYRYRESYGRTDVPLDVFERFVEDVIGETLPTP